MTPEDVDKQLYALLLRRSDLRDAMEQVSTAITQLKAIKQGIEIGTKNSTEPGVQNGP